MSGWQWLTGGCSPIGLDWGSTMVRAVQLRGHGDRLRVHAALALPVAAPTAKAPAPAEPPEGPADDPDPMVDVLRALRRRGGFAGRRVMLHCPGDRIDMRPVALPRAQERLPREAILGALRLELSGQMTIPIEQAVLDYFVIEDRPQDKQLLVMSTLADGAWVQARIAAVQAAGYECLGVDALPCVLARLRTATPQPPETALDADGAQGHLDDAQVLQAWLDIGHEGSTLVVLRGRMPIFCRRFRMGGRRLTRLLAEGLQVEEAAADVLKRRSGIDYRVAGAAGATAAVAEAPAEVGFGHILFDLAHTELDEFLVGLTRSLNYVINEHRAARLDRIVLCGSASQTSNLASYFGEQFGVPVTAPEHPLLEQLAAELPRTRRWPGAWATALGLALVGEPQ